MSSPLHTGQHWPRGVTRTSPDSHSGRAQSTRLQSTGKRRKKWRQRQKTHLRCQSGLKMTKNVIFSELQKTGTNVFLMDQGTFSENLKWLLSKTLKIWGFEVHRTGSRIDFLLWRCAFVDGNHAVLSANDGSGPRDAYQHHNIVRQTMFQVIKELYIQVTNPSVLIISSAVQHQSKCYNDAVYMWQLCTQSHSVVLNLWKRQLHLPPHDAMNWLLLSSTFCRRWTWKLVPSWPGSWSAVAHMMVSGRPSVQRKRVKSQRGG